jgi:hypothetical protein
MDILKMLTELRGEREHIEQAILVLERLAAGARGKRRGRPPKWMSAVTSAASENGDVAEPRKKRRMSAATRKKMAAAQKARWAARKQAKQG